MNEIQQIALSTVLGGGVVGAVMLAALETRLRRVFASHDELNGLSRRLDDSVAGVDVKAERHDRALIGMDDRTGVLEEKLGILQERQSQQWERISEQMASTADTIKLVTAELKEVAKSVQEQAIKTARNHPGT